MRTPFFLKTTILNPQNANHQPWTDTARARALRRQVCHGATEVGRVLSDTLGSEAFQITRASWGSGLVGLGDVSVPLRFGSI